MKLRNIGKKNGKEINLELTKEKILIVPNEEFEVSDERGKKLLIMKVDNMPIVEQIKEVKLKNTDKEE